MTDEKQLEKLLKRVLLNHIAIMAAMPPGRERFLDPAIRETFDLIHTLNEPLKEAPEEAAE